MTPKKKTGRPPSGVESQTIMLTPEAREELHRFAEQQGQSLSTVVNRALQAWYKQNEGRP